jgi:cyclophilin family peptidyl-prolyl cis-trans isomerase
MLINPDTCRSQFIGLRGFHNTPLHVLISTISWPRNLMGAPEATATMSRDHAAFGRLVEELGALQAQMDGASLRETQEKALRRVLYGLYAVVKIHFAKEEEVYLPILDGRLTADEAHQLFEAMGRAAQEARSSVG